MSLHQQINALAAEFAHSLLRAVRGASLEDILRETHAGHSAHSGATRTAPRHATRAPTPRRARGRLRRRSETDIQHVVDRIVSLLHSNKKGLRAEQIRAKLGIQRRELPRPLHEALSKKLVSKKGKKRATTYFPGKKK